MRVRAVVYNVRGFRDGADLVAAVVRRFEPDLLLLNETGGRLRLRRFARSLGMHVAGDAWSPLRRRVKDAILVRPPWRIVERRQHRFAGGTFLYPRGVLIARLEREDRSMWGSVTHLGVRPAERLRHAEELAEIVEALGTPLLLGGDLNDRPDGRAVARLSRGLRDAWLLAGDVEGETFPADRPSARIDYLFVRGEAQVDRVIVAGSPEAARASDHRPVIAELTLLRPGG